MLTIKANYKLLENILRTILISIIMVICSTETIFSIELKTKVENTINIADKLSLTISITYNKNYEKILYEKSDIKKEFSRNETMELKNFILKADALRSISTNTEENKKDYNIYTDKEVKYKRYTNDDIITEEIIYSFQVFETEDIYIKPLKMVYLFRGESQDIYTAPIPITSKKIEILRKEDGKVALIGLKEPFEEKVNIWIYIVIIFSSILLIVLFITTFIKVRRNKRLSDDDDLLSLENVLNEIKIIKQLLDKKNITMKEFYVKISHIAKGFISNVMEISIMENPTSKIKPILESLVSKPDKIDMLIELLNRADMVKFAKYIPTEEEIDTDTNKARNIVIMFEEHRVKEAEKETEKEEMLMMQK